MKTLRQLIGNAPRTPLTVKPDDSVFVALEIMAKQDIGALLVMEGDRLAGIFSERDYARKIILHGKNSTDTKVRDIMTERVIYASPEQTVDQAMAVMSDKNIRHLPVLDADQKVLAVVSQRDLVRETISEQAFQIQQLTQYIAS